MSDEPIEISIDPEPTPAPKRRGRTIGLLVGVVAVVAGAAFAGLALADDANGPEDPVRDLLAAMEQGDVLGAMEQLEPGERDALRQPITDLVDELNRLDVLDADLRDLSGIDVKFDDVELASEQVRAGLALVRITGGTAHALIDADQLPLGGFVKELVGDGLEDTSDESDLASDGYVATVKRGDRWYVSIGYSIAEQARRDAGVSIEDLGDGVEADGADSPEEAVRAMVEAGTSFDVRRAISLLAPGEFGALQEYAGLLDLDEVEVPDDAEVEVTTLELDSDVSGDHATVYVREAELSGSFGDQRFAFEDDCFTYDATKVCAGDDATEALEGLGSGGLFGGMADVEPPKLSFDGEQPKVGIATVKVDGKWYVSPIRTVLDSVVLTARMFEPEDLREIKRYVTDVFESLQESFTTGFEEGLGELDFEQGAAFEPDAQLLEDCLGTAGTEENEEVCHFMFGDGELPVETTTTVP